MEHWYIIHMREKKKEEKNEPAATGFPQPSTASWPCIPAAKQPLNIPNHICERTKNKVPLAPVHSTEHKDTIFQPSSLLLRAAECVCDAEKTFLNVFNSSTSSLK